MNGVSFFDLLREGQRDQSEYCDVCIIGAGAAGIYLAVQLASKGLDVIIVEAGDSVCRDASEVGFNFRFSADPYPGAIKGRAFGLGGTTSRWGGLLIPHTRHDLRDPTHVDATTWRTIVQTVSEKSERVLKVLGYLNPGEFSEYPQKLFRNTTNALNAAGLEVAASLFLPFNYKNLAFLLNKKRTGQRLIRVFVNAIAKAWTIKTELNSRARLQRLSAVASNGNALHVTANRFVIAAGAIESSRILLELNRCADSQLLKSTAKVGHYLGDHLSLSIADVAPSSLGDTARLFAPRFSRDWMRSFRFVESDLPTSAPRGFAHFIFENEHKGFLLAKEVFTALQARRWPRVTSSEVLSSPVNIAALAYAKYFRSSLYIPPGTKAHLQLDIEQTPNHENHISLGSDKDKFGRHVVDIRWRISDLDSSYIQASTRRILQKWPGAKDGFPKLIPIMRNCDSSKPHDAYHPVGTCRMGNDPEAVVDYKLKVFNLSNLWVTSTGVLPSAGSANPTFTMLCLTEALGERLAKSSPNI